MAPSCSSSPLFHPFGGPGKSRISSAPSHLSEMMIPWDVEGLDPGVTLGMGQCHVVVVHSRNSLEYWLQGKFLTCFTTSPCSWISWMDLSSSRRVRIPNWPHFPGGFVSANISKVIPGYSMDFPPFSKSAWDLQVEFGAFLKFLGCLVGKRWEKLLPEGFGAGKSWIFLGLLPCPGLSRIPPSLIFPPQNFSLISPSWAQSRNSSTSQLIPAPRHGALLGMMSSRAPGTAPEWEGAAPSMAFPQLLLLAAFQVNSGGFGI